MKYHLRHLRKFGRGLGLHFLVFKWRRTSGKPVKTSENQWKTSENQWKTSEKWRKSIEDRTAAGRSI